MDFSLDWEDRGVSDEKRPALRKVLNVWTPQIKDDFVMSFIGGNYGIRETGR
jgi:hypothetical protein